MGVLYLRLLSSTREVVPLAFQGVYACVESVRLHPRRNSASTKLAAASCPMNVRGRDAQKFETVSPTLSGVIAGAQRVRLDSATTRGKSVSSYPSTDTTHDTAHYTTRPSVRVEPVELSGMPVGGRWDAGESTLANQLLLVSKYRGHPNNSDSCHVPL